MKQTISLAVFAGMFFVGPVPNAQARQCSNASLQGAYGFHGIATIVPPGTPRAIIGVFTFDGKGHFSATLTINDNGTVTHLPPAGPGTYTVRPIALARCCPILAPSAGREEASRSWSWTAIKSSTKCARILLPWSCTV